MARKGTRSDAAGEAALDLFQGSRPKPRDGLGWGLELHRNVAPKDWPRALEDQVPAEHRAGAEEYLRGIARRIRALRAMARADGFHVVDGEAGAHALDEWRAQRRAQRRLRGEE